MAPSAVKSRKKLLDQRDEFVTVSARALSYIVSHPRPFLFALISLLVLGAAFVTYNLYDNRQERQAALALHEARALYPPLLARPKLGKSEVDSAITKLEEVIRRYPRTSSAFQATFYLGQIQYRLGDYSKAAQTFQYATRRASTPMFRELALMNLGNAQEAMGDCRAAISSYQGVAADKAIFQDRALESTARCYEVLGDRAKAIDFYNQVLQKFPQTPWAEEIKDRLSRLQAAG